MKSFFTNLLCTALLAVAMLFSCTFANAQTAKPAAAKPAAKKPAATPKTETAKPAAATGAPAGKSITSIIETFFKRYKTSSDSAIDYLFSTNTLFTNQAQINLLKSKLDSLQFSLGKYEGRELIAQKSAGTSLVIYSYLIKRENQPLRFTFMFYKPKNDWELYRFNYDDAMDLELIEAAKINNKKQ